jgi:chromosome segregation ATPase
VKELETQFAEVEKRVRSLVADNGSLRKRVAELERELARARAEAGDARDVQGKQARIREKVEHVLRSLQSLGERKEQAG